MKLNQRTLFCTALAALALWSGGLARAETALDNIMAYQEGQGEVKFDPPSDFFGFMGSDDGFLSLVAAPEIKSFADLKGKRVSTGSPGSATEVMAFRLIEAAGLDKDKDLKRERLGVAESVNAIKDGKIDAFFWVGGLPTAAVTDLANTPGVKIKMIDHADAVANMNRKYGNLYVEDTIPKDMYKGMDHDNKQATVMNILVVHENMDEKTAYNIVKTMFDKRDDLIAAHKEATNLRLDAQKQAATPIPYHPGAARFFAEKGVKVN